MAALKDKIQEDLKTAMKARAQHKVTTLRGVMAALKQIEVDERKEVVDADVTSVLQKEIKKRREALKYAEQQQRADLIEQNKAELDMLQEYVGAPLGSDELKEIITKLMQNGADNIGKIMGGLNKEYKGRFDGKEASSLVKAALEEK